MEEKNKYLSQTREILSKINLFKNFNTEQLDKIIELAEYKRYNKGELIIKENSIGNELFVLLEGQVVIFKISEKGTRIDLTDLSKGDFFGELSLFDGKPRSASVETQDSSNLLVFTKDHLMAFTRIYPEIIFEVVSELGSRLRFLNERFVEEVVESQEETSNKARKIAIMEMLIGTSDLFANSLRAQNKKIGEIINLSNQEKIDQNVLRELTVLQNTQNQILTNVKSIERLIGSLSKKQLFNISTEVDLVLNLLYEDYTGKIEIIRDFRDSSNITASRDLLTQVIKVVIQNAIDSVDDKGVVTISTFNEGDFVHLVVEDNGKSVSDENIGRIFELGFTTKEKAETAGVNLWLSRAIVRWHGGDITVEKSGQNTKFVVKVPV